jgi:hypothetical protein
MYYDRHSHMYDDAACQSNDENDRCVKMDCHEPNTHFKLIGFFKEPNYREWLEQLFKYEGDCVWDDNEYEFMQRYREDWPQYCTKTEFSENGNYLYYDTKPSSYGSMDIGLYTDYKCVEEYTGNATTVESVLYAAYSSDYAYGLEKELKAWNDAFDVFKTCLPCRAVDLIDIVAGSNAEKSGDATERYSFYENDDDQDDDRNTHNEDEGFRCNEDSGSADVNQCMKFKTTTNMYSASINDVILAENQGSVTAVQIGITTYGETESRHRTAGFQQLVAWALLGCSASWLVMSVIQYRRVRQKYSNTLSEPLVASSGVSS